jgi:hypothetical protein
MNERLFAEKRRKKKCKGKPKNSSSTSPIHPSRLIKRETMSLKRKKIKYYESINNFVLLLESLKDFFN